MFVGGLWGWFLESWRLLGTLLGGLGGSLDVFFGTWAAPWVTFSDLGGFWGDLVAPNGSQNQLFGISDAFWASFLEVFGSRSGVLGGHLGASWWLLVGMWLFFLVLSLKV